MQHDSPAIWSRFRHGASRRAVWSTWRAGNPPTSGGVAVAAVGKLVRQVFPPPHLRRFHKVRSPSQRLESRCVRVSEVTQRIEGAGFRRFAALSPVSFPFPSCGSVREAFAVHFARRPGSGSVAAGGPRLMSREVYLVASVYRRMDPKRRSPVSCLASVSPKDTDSRPAPAWRLGNRKDHLEKPSRASCLTDPSSRDASPICSREAAAAGSGAGTG